MRSALLRSVHDAGVKVLNTQCPASKSAQTGAFFKQWGERTASWCEQELEAPTPPLGQGTAPPPDEPARPDRPLLMDERSMPSPKALGVKPAAYILHALAHIELNAVDLYWDVMVRSVNDGLPVAFYSDLLGVAADEALHFTLLADRLAAGGLRYGDIPAHTVRRPWLRLLPHAPLDP